MALSWPPGCLLAAQTVALSGCHRHPGDPVHPSNSVLLSTTHPPFCSVSRCLSGVPEVDARGAPLPLTAAAASLLPASRRVPGPVAGLHHTPPLLLPPATCGLPTPFSTSFPPRRSRSVMGEGALVLLGVVVERGLDYGGRGGRGGDLNLNYLLTVTHTAIITSAANSRPPDPPLQGPGPARSTPSHLRPPGRLAKARLSLRRSLS